MSTRIYSGYWFIILLFFSSFSLFSQTKSEGKTSKHIWVLGTVDSEKDFFIQEKLGSYIKKNQVDIVSVVDRSKEAELAEMAKLMKADDSYIFLTTSFTLVQHPELITDELRGIHDFFSEGKLAKIISKLQFVIKENPKESIDKERAYYYLFRHHIRLERIQKQGHYDQKELNAGMPEKDLHLLDPFGKAVEKKRIFIWNDGTVHSGEILR